MKSIKKVLKLLNCLVILIILKSIRKKLKILFLDNVHQVLESANDHQAVDNEHLYYKQDFLF